MSVPGGTDDRGDFERAIEATVARMQERIETCYERRPCSVCGAEQGVKCVHRTTGRPVKRPHFARWTPDVPQR
jgi:hypothetical protein